MAAERAYCRWVLSDSVGRRRVLSDIWGYVRSAPWTFTWLALLLVTTIIQHSVSSSTLDRMLEKRSTNLNNLHHDPIKVLYQSLMWIDGGHWWPYLLSYCIFHATAERWLGSLRWLVVGLSAHVLATYISEGLLGVAIRHGEASSELVDVRDIGVSYFLAAIVGVLTYHIAYPWRWLYLILALGKYGLPVIGHLSFTAIGHLTSLLIGLAFYPIIRGRENKLLDPMKVYRWGRKRVAAARAPKPQNE